MSERKVQNKYYPPDYDPSKVPRVKRKNKQRDVRIMAPLNMKCSTCGNYIANATKFNAKKETVEDETYNNLLIFRFYIKCPRCMATIIFRTNPKEQAYEVEHGATENFMALKTAERQALDEAKAEEEEEKIDPMKQLEKRTKASRQQMEASEQIQSLRSIKYKMHSVDLDSIIQSKREEGSQASNLAITYKSRDMEDDEIRAEAKRLMNQRDKQLTETTSSVIAYRPTSSGAAMSTNRTAPTSSKMLSSSLSNLKKKIKLVNKSKTNNSL